MTTPSYKPVFGPNGAVMNAPTMTPDMREKIDQSSLRPTRKKLGEWAVLIGGYALWVLVAAGVTRIVQPLLPPSMEWAIILVWMTVGIALGLVGKLFVRRRA